MEFEDKQRIVSRIISGFSRVSIKDKVLKVYDYTLNNEYDAQAEYDIAYKHYINNGVSTKEELEAILVEKKLWGTDQETTLKELYNNIKTLRKKLKDLVFKSNEKKQTLKYIEITEHEIKKLENQKLTLLQNSAEYLAKMEKHKYLLYQLTFDGDKRYWADINAFKKEPEQVINRLLMNSFFDQSITEPVIRELARCEPWRTIWITAVKTGNLFARPLVEMTEYQRALVNWSNIYDSVYESMDCPSQEVIHDDKQLDAWFEEQAEKRNKEKNGIDQSKLPEGQEVMIPVDSEEDARKVYELNNQLGKGVIHSRSKAIEKHSGIKEQNLPDVKQALIMQANSAQFNKK